ncbi:hypothetical protein Lser_V15G08909 [Lactuca serriola]
MNTRQPISFSCFVIFLIAASIDGGNETDYQALLKFKSMIRNEEALISWNASFHFCDWSGVYCGRRHRRVTVLLLESQGLQGSLSPHVGNLSFLRFFSLWNNSFQGSIPHELGRLSRLRFLYLGSNKFNGVIPTNLTRCSNLKEIGLNNNNLVGSIPKGIGFLSKLTYLSVDDNNLTGGIPRVLGNITSMELFSAAENPLGGSIPDTLGHWNSLTQLYLGDCNLSGTIPHSIFNFSLLTDFSLSENQLTGSLPSALGTMLPHLRYLQLWGNQLTGTLPPSISNCSKLDFLEVHLNNFSGKLEIDFAEMKDMYFISLGGNNIYGSGGADDMKFIDTLKNCSRLETLDLFRCTFQGPLPASIGNLSDRLSYLSLGGNRIHGNLPPGIGNLIGLTNLGLEDNQFTGKIPSTIGKLQNLQIASLHYNQFSGPIPDAIGNLSLLTKLWLNSNKLEGQIPSSLGNCHHLLELHLDDNKLSGKIPTQLLQLSSLTIALNLSQNNLVGSLPTEVGNLKMLTYLDLSNNNLSGNIPSSIGGCTSLVFLSLKGNLFQGHIPTSLSSMRAVSTLDLSHNKLSGQFPRFLQRLTLLEYANLSFNDFQGNVPVIGVFANASAFSVLGNNRLCGGLAEIRLPKCNTKKHNKKLPLFIILILFASTLFTILCFANFLCKKKKSQPSQSSRGERFMKVSYSQLLKATNGFSQANLIGEGGFSSVYKGVLDDTIVAVKVVHLQNQGAHRSFTAECEVWRGIRHRNLVKIITSCSSVDYHGNDFKALVYEFMPNGSLHDWLHSSPSTSRLNLFQRINILMDIASTIDYLHNHCPSPIIHCDLKPSNILLDDDMVAHVGDFGLARFLGTNPNKKSTSGIRGTIGYAPPVAEYGVGSEMTSSGDVYSFGILLLEVMTGKRPTDNIFNEGLTLHKFAYMALPDHVTDVIDDDLLYFLQEDATATQYTSAHAKKIEECLASIIKLGVSCSVDSPPQRMNIKNVVRELQKILDTLQNIHGSMFSHLPK